jgi:predicted exporter
MRIIVFWDVMLCMLAYHCCGREVCYFHLQGMLLIHRLSCFDYALYTAQHGMVQTQHIQMC